MFTRKLGNSYSAIAKLKSTRNALTLTSLEGVSAPPGKRQAVPMMAMGSKGVVMAAICERYKEDSKAVNRSEPCLSDIRNMYQSCSQSFLLIQPTT